MIRALALPFPLALAAACAHDESTAPVGATSTADSPATMTVASGDAQSALGGSPLAQPVSFRLTDKNGNGVAKAVVNFDVTNGEGTLTPGLSPAITDATGFATAPTWTLGKLAIPQQLRASSGTITATAIATVKTQYHAELRFFGAPVDAAYLPAFARAIGRLNAEVVGALTAVSFSNQDVANTCGATGVPPLSEQIGSIVIYVSVGPGDGVGGVIATSGPCYVRQSNKLTVVGTMLFDVADLRSLSAGQLSDVVFHELQHVLGFGTLWSTVTPPLIINAGTAQSGFTGATGIRACQLAGGPALDCAPMILLESGGGAGTADQHWRGSVFGNELMTAFLPAQGVAKSFSAMSLGSITDLGYQTNPNVVDSYTIPSALAAAYLELGSLQSSGVAQRHDMISRPRFAVTRDGVASPLP